MANGEMEGESQMREERYAADISSIREAEARIRPFIPKTPVFSSESLDALSGTYFSNVNCSKRGGGLISGVALAAKSLNPAIRVIAAEPARDNDAAQSKAAGKIITLPETNTIADGLEAFLGDLTWPIVRDLVDDVITMEDGEIVKAMKLCYEILKTTVEPSGAIGLAVVLSDSFNQNPAWKSCNNIGIILSGGNVDLGLLWNSFEK